MKQYTAETKITYVISSDKVRSMCIRHDWYTGGNNEEYSDLLEYVDRLRHGITMDALVSIAVNIVEHSNMDDMNSFTYEEQIDNVLFFIIRECVDIFPSIDNLYQIGIRE